MLGTGSTRSGGTGCGGVEEGRGEDGEESHFKDEDVPLEGEPGLSNGLQTQVGDPAYQE